MLSLQTHLPSSKQSLRMFWLSADVHCVIPHCMWISMKSSLWACLHLAWRKYSRRSVHSPSSPP